MFGKNLLKTLATAAVLTVMAGGAQAASVACNTFPLKDVTNLVIPNIGCEVLTSDSNDNNAAVSGMFGVTDWDQIAKINFPDNYGGGTLSSNGFLTITGDTETGIWSISASVLSAWENVMLIFKAANDNADVFPGAVIGYLINSSPGTYESPVFGIQGGKGPLAGTFKTKDISHISLYVSTPAAVPVPAAGLLLLGALGGLAALRRRRRV